MVNDEVDGGSGGRALCWLPSTKVPTVEPTKIPTMAQAVQPFVVVVVVGGGGGWWWWVLFYV